MFVADPDADLEYSLVEWRRWRKRRRLAKVHVIDALYQADLAAIFGSAAFFLLTGLIGGERLDAADLATVKADGAGWLGVVTAVAVAVGLRSGCRGGPLVLEQAEVRHVLLAPVDRAAVFRGPLARQLRFLVFAAAVVGLAVGHLAARRLEGHAGWWMLSGAGFTLATVTVAFGAAASAASARLASWIGTALGGGLVAWALADASGVVGVSPTAAWGQIGMWPTGFHWWAVVALVLSVVPLVWGFLRIGHLSLEGVERRSRLVGELRFAATLQDVRTVIVLRRQLALELPRLRPWWRVRVRGTDRFPVWSRGLRGALRWPAARVGRLALLGIVAGLALRGAWDGTPALLGAAAVALYLAGLDAVEALAQEMDHPSRTELMPIPRGNLDVRHLPIAVAVMAAVTTVTSVTFVLSSPSADGLGVGLVMIVPAALGAVAGAAVSVLLVADPIDAFLMPPEATGLWQAMRVLRPFSLAVLGLLPALAAASAVDEGRSGVDAAVAVTVPVVIVFGLFAAWVWQRESMRRVLSRVTRGSSSDR